MTGTDQIMLFDGVDHRTVLPWPHPWPPWEHLTMVTGIHTGVQAALNFEGLTELAEHCRQTGTTMEKMYRRTTYELVSCSELPEDVALDPTSHVFRAARYAEVKPMTAADEVSAIDGTGF